MIQVARHIKVYGTMNTPNCEIIEALHRLGAPKLRRQFRIICGATSMAEANRLCEAEGVGHGIFKREYTCETFNGEEVALAGNGGIFIALQHFYGSKTYYSIEQLKGEM